MSTNDLVHGKVFLCYGVTMMVATISAATSFITASSPCTSDDLDGISSVNTDALSDAFLNAEVGQFKDVMSSDNFLNVSPTCLSCLSDGIALADSNSGASCDSVNATDSHCAHHMARSLVSTTVNCTLSTDESIETLEEGGSVTIAISGILSILAILALLN